MIISQRNPVWNSGSSFTIIDHSLHLYCDGSFWKHAANSSIESFDR